MIDSGGGTTPVDESSSSVLSVSDDALESSSLSRVSFIPSLPLERAFFEASDVMVVIIARNKTVVAVHGFAGGWGAWGVGVGVCCMQCPTTHGAACSCVLPTLAEIFVLIPSYVFPAIIMY